MPFLLLIIILMLFACSDDDTNPTYPFERSVLDMSIAQTCEDCYILRWHVPIETKDLQSFHVWLDTTVVRDSAQNISSSQISNASANKEYNKNSNVDSLDLTELIKPYLERDSVHLAILAQYSTGDQGAVQHTFVHFGDNTKPSFLRFNDNDSVSANTIYVNWDRPTDQKDFYHPEINNGPIAYYNVIITADDEKEDIRNISIKVSIADTVLNASNIKKKINAAEPYRLELDITDSKGVDFQDEKNNKWKMEISGLKIRSTYSLSITAYDIAGNSSTQDNSAPETRTILTTDEFPPTIANEILVLGMLDSNRLVISWTNSSDASEIGKYILEQLNGEIWESVPRIASFRENGYDFYSAFATDTLRWVSPAEKITLRLRAVDNTGYYSAPLIQTIMVPGENNCSEGFAQVKNDEQTFCMEKYERSGNVLYEEAKNLCEADGYKLCTEAQWNAACTSGGVKYGVIEERDFDPENFLSKKCGVGTNVSGNRNNICVSPDGVRDLPGQLQEWVVADDNTPILKGTSYKAFQGPFNSGAELAQCSNSFTPKIGGEPALYTFKDESVGFRCCY